MDEKIAKAVDVLAKATGIFSALGRESCTMEEKEFFSEYLPRLEEMLQEQLVYYGGSLWRQTDILAANGLGFLAGDQKWRYGRRKALEAEIDAGK